MGSNELNANSEKVSLAHLSQLTGFSEDIIARELNLKANRVGPTELTLDELRKAMVSFLDSGLMES